MAAVSACPEPAKLAHLLLGKVAEPESSQLCRHLAQCGRCGTVVHTLKVDDTLVEAMRSPGDTSSGDEKGLVDRLVCRVKELWPGASGSLADRGTVTLGSAASQAPVESAEESPIQFLSPAQQADEIGRLGSYRILKLLGKGGMGMVFQAEDIQLKRRVALKVMLPTVARRKDARDRFLLEAQAAAAIEHDHIVAIHHVGQENGVPFLAMPWLKGMSLEERLKKSGKLPSAQVLRLGRQIALGLAAAHANGLIHRDIKPGNLWIEPEHGGRIKILDFGLAKVMESGVASAPREEHLTQTGTILGTPAYMAPEQAQGQKVGPACDLFSLGVVLYRLCTGQMPFQADNTTGLLIALVMSEPVAPKTVNPDVPMALSDLILHLLAKDPAKRPASAKEVAARLQILERDLKTTTVSEPEALAKKSEPEALAKGGVPAFAHAAGSVNPPEAGTAAFAFSAITAPKSKQAPSAPKKPRRPMLTLALWLLGGIFLVAAATYGIIYIPTPEGAYVIDTDDPDFSFSVSKGTVILEDKKTKRKYNLKVVHQDKAKGEFELEVTDADSGLVFSTKTFTIKRGDKVALKAWFKRPDPTVFTPPDYALRFDGKTKISPLPLVLELSQPFTIEAYLTKNETQIHGSCISTYSTIDLASSNSGWSFVVRDSKDKLLGLSYPSAFGVKTHVAGVSTGKAMLLFVNGKLVGSKNFEKGPPNTRIPLTVGNSFLGLISEIRISQKARYDKDFTPAKRFETDADTLALYHCDEGKGDILKDSSGNGHHGKIVGAKWVKSDGSPILPPGVTPVDDAWLKMVAAMPADKQVDAVAAKLKDLNPGFDGKVTPTLDKDGAVATLSFLTDEVTDISPVRALTKLHALECKGSDGGKGKLADLSPVKELKLITLHCYRNQVSDLSPLKDMKTLSGLNCSHTKVSDLSPLKGLKLGSLLIDGAPVSDLAPLKDMKLKTLICNYTKIGDLSPLRDMPLTSLGFSYTKVADLSPLKGMKLTGLTCGATNVADLSPLKGMPLTNLMCQETKVTDLSALKGMPLVELVCDFKAERDAEILRATKTLVSINDKPAGAFWKEVDAGSPNATDADRKAAEWVLSIGGTVFIDDGKERAIGTAKDLPAGPWTLNKVEFIQNKQVTDTGLKQLAGLKNLKDLNLSGTQVTDAGLENLVALPALTQLQLEDARISAKGYSTLKAELPKVKIEWSEPNHAAALAVLEAGGQVRIQYVVNGEKSQNTTNDPVHLPKEYFKVNGVDLQSVQKPLDKVVSALAKLNDPKFDYLETLDLTNSSMTDADLQFLAKLPHLTSLSLTQTAITDAGLKALAGLTSLQTLSLWGTQVSDAGLKELAGLNNLQTLGLSGAKVTDAGLKELAGLKNLKALNLSGTQVTGAGLKELAGIKNLQWLGLHHTKVTDAGLKELARLKNLQSLRLDDTPVTDAGLKELAGHKSLRELDLGNTKVTDAGLVHLDGLAELKSLNLKQTPVTATGIKALQKALPGCQITSDVTPAAKATPVDAAWLKLVAALPPGKQVDTVAAKLKDLNPGFNSAVKSQKVGPVVVQVEFFTDNVTDISPLRALTGLKYLSCRGSNHEKGILADLSPLKGLALTTLDVTNTKVADLSPLKGMPLTALKLINTSVTDIAALKDMKLKSLDLSGVKQVDLTPLKGLPLESLALENGAATDLTPLKGLSLKRLECQGSPITDLSPLAGMPLEHLNLQNTKVTTLGPLKNSPLKELYIHNSAIADLSPLKGMKLTTLNCFDSKVTDLSPLHGMPLKVLWSKIIVQRDVEILSSLTSLETINGIKAKDFWKKVNK